VTSRPDVSVIIPVHDAGATVGRLVAGALAVAEVDVEVVAVDDASTDDSVDQLARLDSPRLVVERFERNAGAGVARNRGLELATGRYALFFDADDELHVDALVEAVRSLDDTGADVAFLPYRYRRGRSAEHDGMNAFDSAAWSRYTSSRRRLTRLGDVPQLLGFSNYPWNKVLRTDHHRDAGLRFSATVVHNDILGHWLTLLDARTILLLDVPLCTHIVNEGARNLTNRESRARLSLLDALEETLTELERRPEKRARYAHHYWDFVLRVSRWAAGRLTPDVVDEFNARLATHLMRIDLGDLNRIRSRRDPDLASRLVRRALV
jgi:glycosyltransferase involved in cell wall biosynthesis